MKIEEVKELKSDLEREVYEKISKFEELTSTVVESVYIRRVPEFGNPHRLVNVETEVRI